MHFREHVDAERGWIVTADPWPRTRIEPLLGRGNAGLGESIELGVDARTDVDLGTVLDDRLPLCLGVPASVVERFLAVEGSSSIEILNRKVRGAIKAEPQVEIAPCLQHCRVIRGETSPGKKPQSDQLIVGREIFLFDPVYILRPLLVPLPGRRWARGVNATDTRIEERLYGGIGVCR